MSKICRRSRSRRPTPISLTNITFVDNPSTHLSLNSTSRLPTGKEPHRYFLSAKTVHTRAETRNRSGVQRM